MPSFSSTASVSAAPCCLVFIAAGMEPLKNPFDTIDEILKKLDTPNVILDFHAETTSEKRAMGFYLDGRVSLVAGTHTHVQTADEQILPHGSGYITDLGMTGPVDGIIGTESAAVIERFRTKMPTRFRVATGEIRAEGALFTLDDSRTRVKMVERVRF